MIGYIKMAVGSILRLFRLQPGYRLRTSPALPLCGIQRRWKATPTLDLPHMFDKIVVANRGEIACRVMRTARRMGVKTVAVYSEADKDALHVKMADEAFCIGPPPSNESYLRQDRILVVARETGAQAIHPGYGFLSENSQFSGLCSEAGIEFIGPPASAIEKMGIKRLSKQIMSSSDVPIVPGYFGEEQSDQRLKEEAHKIGFPVLLKADLGGGGKGMRIVHDPSNFNSLLAECRSESLKSFGDDTIMVEKFVPRPRHVEVQVFADKSGSTVHLFERDCSVQRRHQKVIEEAPAPFLRDEVRQEICSAAVRAACAVGYVGAGTVEFIMDDHQDYYFMEMNTRLQVEHPITEMITGVDLVEWQLKVAAGYPLPLKQSELNSNGHAFEARIYAEDPGQGFVPSPGLLKYLNPPPASDTVRIDTGVTQGDEVSSFYDPMIAKLVVWSEDRAAALKKLRDALHSYQIAGLTTNVDFLGRLAAHPSFAEGDVHTGFIEQHKDVLFAERPLLSLLQGAQAVTALVAWEAHLFRQSTAFEHDPHSPFNSCNGMRVNTKSRRKMILNCGDEELIAEIEYTGENSFVIHKLYRTGEEDSAEALDLHVKATLEEEDGGRQEGVLRLKAHVGDNYLVSNLAVIDRTFHLFSELGNYQVVLPTPAFYETNKQGSSDGLRSPTYSSRVSKVFVSPGDKVAKGDTLITVEGMKMETTVLAPTDGIIKEVLFVAGDTVPASSRLLYFQDEEN